jgi:hypothetical protein
LQRFLCESGKINLIRLFFAYWFSNVIPSNEIIFWNLEEDRECQLFHSLELKFNFT